MNSIGRAKSDSGMKSYLFKAKHNWTGFFLAFAGNTALMAANDPAGATKVRNEQFAESRPADEPIMAIISLHDQLGTQRCKDRASRQIATSFARAA
jgi:hypothetical protein